jgi:hypothetical protein
MIMTTNEEAQPTAVTLVGWLRGSTGLQPVAKKAPWIVCGLLIQASGIAIVLAWAYRTYKDDAVEGAALRTTFKLIWMDTLHSRTGVAILIGSAVLFAAGSMLLARPYVQSLPMLVVGVPVAAVAGLALLGALALVVALIAFLAYVGFEAGSGSGGGRGSTTSLDGLGSIGGKKKDEAAAGAD